MSQFSAYDTGVMGLSIGSLKVEGSTRVRDLVLKGFESVVTESPSKLMDEFKELVNCFAVQFAIEEEISYTTCVVTTESLYQRGYELLDTTSVNEMAEYISSKNPLFWEEMVSHNKDLDLLLV